MLTACFRPRWRIPRAAVLVRGLDPAQARAADLAWAADRAVKAGPGVVRRQPDRVQGPSKDAPARAFPEPSDRICFVDNPCAKQNEYPTHDAASPSLDERSP